VVACIKIKGLHDLPWCVARDADVATLGTMAKPKLKKRLVVRIPAPLITKLKDCAERDGRPLSSFVRKVLADAADLARP
jgi:predicted DNA binding CopG/RHH family protein